MAQAFWALPPRHTQKEHAGALRLFLPALSIVYLLLVVLQCLQVVGLLKIPCPEFFVVILRRIILIGAYLATTGSGVGSFAIVNNIANRLGRAPPSSGPEYILPSIAP